MSARCCRTSASSRDRAVTQSHCPVPPPCPFPSRCPPPAAPLEDPLADPFEPCGAAQSSAPREAAAVPSASRSLVTSVSGVTPLGSVCPLCFPSEGGGKQADRPPPPTPPSKNVRGPVPFWSRQVSRSRSRWVAAGSSGSPIGTPYKVGGLPPDSASFRSDMRMTFPVTSDCDMSWRDGVTGTVTASRWSRCPLSCASRCDVGRTEGRTW